MTQDSGSISTELAITKRIKSHGLIKRQLRSPDVPDMRAELYFSNSQQILSSPPVTDRPACLYAGFGISFREIIRPHRDSFQSTNVSARALSSKLHRCEKVPAGRASGSHAPSQRHRTVFKQKKVRSAAIALRGCAKHYTRASATRSRVGFEPVYDAAWGGQGDVDDRMVNPGRPHKDTWPHDALEAASLDDLEVVYDTCTMPAILFRVSGGGEKNNKSEVFSGAPENELLSDRDATKVSGRKECRI
ncbi:hypothetical protein EDD15DRAFT_2192157 [Pisolithus albus]|nr:hypothetical protein EDD15DRAFT_2192157 [Pisolithus albus]